ncbi:hypothetical protein GY45DRAFT_1320877 [Cubamyces sp. BRFM 1775]|nr:hypothetical protein GY45DRAFT_1320877 [Cubamyces sp. BRFM 1775]
MCKTEFLCVLQYILGPVSRGLELTIGMNGSLPTAQVRLIRFGVPAIPAHKSTYTSDADCTNDNPLTTVPDLSVGLSRVFSRDHGGKRSYDVPASPTERSLNTPIFHEVLKKRSAFIHIGRHTRHPGSAAQTAAAILQPSTLTSRSAEPCGTVRVVLHTRCVFRWCRLVAVPCGGMSQHLPQFACTIRLHTAPT